VGVESEEQLSKAIEVVLKLATPPQVGCTVALDRVQSICIGGNAGLYSHEIPA
jgi:hypothetical protein